MTLLGQVPYENENEDEGEGKGAADVYDHGDLVEHISEYLVGVDTEHLIEMYERCFPNKVLNYMGDSLYEIEKKG